LHVRSLRRASLAQGRLFAPPEERLHSGWRRTLDDADQRLAL